MMNWTRKTFCWFCVIQAAVGAAIIAANMGPALA
jgi:hypothetical protein